MCNILILEPNTLPPYEFIQNVVWNNPHGYGLILKDVENSKLQVVKKTILENDPKEIYDILEDNIDLQRFLHVRNKTEGDLSAENQHPFSSYHSDKRQVYFMHNGTLSDYSPAKTWVNNKFQQSEQKDSDSKRFNDEVIAPFLLRIKGEQGFGDIQDQVTKNIISKFWGSSFSENRGLLVSNDQEPFFINREKWLIKKFKGDNTEYITSNDTYFEKLIRGPEYERREKEKKPTSFASAHNRGSNSKNEIISLKSVNFKKEVGLTDNLKDLFIDSEIWGWKGISQIANLTPEELREFTSKNPIEAADFFQYVASEFHDLEDRYSKATNYIEKMEG